ncbi:efflux RND transporter periplasmic adaptor subunit [Luteibacter anthropi]|uniref:efflux RND transporter periplasmic adaptor subunit n=1 Tax=Luteibacter anthropi TaxID=564369 RepID=UPI0020323D59|nr:efflux RND transporter periplasmic adaptor subunit [Luteibacter anthropi]URX61171.1 efflux RND transporter periplasmic adaptor subunit [Luteibacter anthropi]
MKPFSRRPWRLAYLLLLPLLVACGKQEAPAVPPPVVTVTTVAPVVTQVTDDLPGRVVAGRTAEIRAQVSGIVTRRLFEQGSVVKAGEPLFQINPAPFQAEADSAAATLKRSQAALAQAEITVRRLTGLVDADAISRQVYDNAVAQRDQAAAEVAQAQANLARRKVDLGFATIRSPISGRIGQELVTEGALVSQSDAQPMARVQQMDEVYVDVRQPAGMLAAVRAQADQGTPRTAHFLGDGNEPMPLEGQILFSDLRVDEGTGDVVMRIAVHNDKGLLLPGMFVRARVPRGAPRPMLRVPQEAVARDTAGNPSLWIVDAQHKAHPRPVRLGPLVDRQYVIEDGLAAGESVVVEGFDRLQADVVVNASPWKPADAGGQAAVAEH